MSTIIQLPYALDGLEPGIRGRFFDPFIYHVMLRGINRQDIFEDAEDYMRMLRCMQLMLEQYDDLGNHLPPLCTFYTYSRVDV